MGGAGQEIELKLRVADRAALDAIERTLGGTDTPPARQRNHFFDTPARGLRRGALGLRLREEAGQFTLTAKGPSQKNASGALAVRQEEEVELSADTARALLEGQQSPLAVLEEALTSRAGVELTLRLRAATGGDALSYVGCFENLRTRIHAQLPAAGGPLPVVLELDETSFPGGVTEYEVEVELGPEVDASEAEEALRALLATAGVDGTPARGKASRFFEALESRRPKTP